MINSTWMISCCSVAFVLLLSFPLRAAEEPPPTHGLDTVSVVAKSDTGNFDFKKHISEFCKTYLGMDMPASTAVAERSQAEEGADKNAGAETSPPNLAKESVESATAQCEDLQPSAQKGSSPEDMHGCKFIEECALGPPCSQSAEQGKEHDATPCSQDNTTDGKQAKESEPCASKQSS